MSRNDAAFNLLRRRLAALKAYSGLSDQRLAGVLGTTRMTLWRWAHGRARPAKPADLAWDVWQIHRTLKMAGWKPTGKTRAGVDMSFRSVLARSGWRPTWSGGFERTARPRSFNR